MNIAFPFQVDARGHTASATPSQNLRQMVELVLFTRPGERVNRPDFGTDLLGLVFSPNPPIGALAVQTLIQSALRRWLGDLLTQEEIVVEADDSTLRIQVRYVDRTTGTRDEVSFEVGP